MMFCVCLFVCSTCAQKTLYYSYRSMDLSSNLCSPFFWFACFLFCIFFMFFLVYETNYPGAVVLITRLCNFQQRKVVMEWIPVTLFRPFSFSVDFFRPQLCVCVLCMCCILILIFMLITEKKSPPPHIHTKHAHF